MRYTCLRLRLTSHTDDLPKVSRISESSVGEEVEVLDLVEGRLRVGDCHLRSSGRHAREKGHKGPRHTNENAAPWNAARMDLVGQQRQSARRLDAMNE